MQNVEARDIKWVDQLRFQKAKLTQHVSVLQLL